MVGWRKGMMIMGRWDGEQSRARVAWLGGDFERQTRKQTGRQADRRGRRVGN